LWYDISIPNMQTKKRGVDEEVRISYILAEIVNLRFSGKI